jgi:hypothetical protein
MNDNLMKSSSVWQRDHRKQPGRLPRSSLLHAVPRLVIASLLLASCAQAPTESRASTNVITGDRLDADKIVSNRVNATALISHPLADAQLRVNSSATALFSTPEGIELFSFIAACALPSAVMLTATIDGNEFQFFGDIGLTPQWLSIPLNLTGQRWVSACVFARVNGHQVIVPLSARGPNPALNANADERASFTLEEGAFYGNMFVPSNQAIQWFACRGRDQAASDGGILADRDCTEPDPAKPSVTRCGFAYAGSCGSFGADQACESFSTAGTFYRRCHTAPIQPGPSFDVFEEVITTFVQP